VSSENKVVVVQKCVVQDWPDAHAVRLHVGNQHFPVGDAWETREEADFYAGMLRQALARLAGPDIDTMVNRFLGWKLPADFHPDAGVSFKPYDPPEYPHMREQRWPAGTNLLTAAQAKAMFEYVLADSKEPQSP
jgi:hypothetical protein